MKHYRIIKKTAYAINEHGEVNVRSRFLAYKRSLWFLWDRLQRTEIFGCGWVHSASVGFNTLEEAENFVRKYHENRSKVGKYTLEVVENINLK